MPFVPDGGFLIPRTKQPDRSYGLLTSIDPIHLPDPHWQSGFEWESDCSIDTSSTLPPCPDPVASKAVDGGLVFCSADPFTVYGSYKCSTGGRSAAESMSIAETRLQKNKESGVERIFWTGITSVGTINPSLQGGNESCDIFPIDITPVSGALSAVGAIAALESNIVDCIPGGLGVIHLNHGVLAFLYRDHMAIDKNGRFYTPSGQLLVAGAGYPGSGPGNVPAVAGESWMFATGPVSVYYSDVFYNPTNIDQAIDRNLNNITFWVEQTYAVIWECCIFAVRVKIC